MESGVVAHLFNASCEIPFENFPREKLPGALEHELNPMLVPWDCTRRVVL